jgi:fructokinase
MENIQFADIVRGSDEDFRNILQTETAEDTYNKLKGLCSVLVYTANTKGVFVFTDRFTAHHQTKKIKPVSTIGAGDNFNAGIIYSLMKHNTGLDAIQTLDTKNWGGIIRIAIDFATDVCLSVENYVSEHFVKRMTK